MARTALPITQGSQNAETAVVPVAADATNDMVIDATVATDKVIVYLAGDSTNPITYDFLAGDGSLASQGDLQVVLAATTDAIVTLESARFKDDEGNINIDVTGTVATATMAAVAVV